MRKSLIIPCIILAALLILSFTRWDYGATKAIDNGYIKWKIDRWSGQGWIEVYSTEGFQEVPRLPGTTIIRDAWTQRNDLTDWWNIAFVATLTVLLWNAWLGPRLKKWNDKSYSKKEPGDI